MMDKIYATNLYRSDTLIVSARVDSFYDVFLGEWAWYPVRIDDRRKNDLKWISVYQNSPVRSITHYARIRSIENYMDSGRYKIVFDEPIDMPKPISLGSESGLTMQGQRYTSLERLLRAESISDLKPWNPNATN